MKFFTFLSVYSLLLLAFFSRTLCDLSLVGGVAQWLGCRSLAGRFPFPEPELWLTGDHFVGKLSPMGQPTKPS